MDKPEFYPNNLFYGAIQWLSEYNEPVDVSADNAGTINELMDQDSYRPEVIYYKDGFDVLTRGCFTKYEGTIEDLDFSNCESATKCVMLEAQALVDAAMESVKADVEKALRDLGEMLTEYVEERNYDVVSGQWELSKPIPAFQGEEIEEGIRVWINKDHALIESIYHDPDNEECSTYLTLKAEVVKLGKVS